MLMGTKTTPSLTHARYASTISRLLARYTQSRSPLARPREASRFATRLLRSSTSPKVSVRPWNSRAVSARRPVKERSNRSVRFIANSKCSKPRCRGADIALYTGMMFRLCSVWVLACLILSGCHGSRKKVIGVVPKGTSHLFWQTVQAGAIAAGRDLGVDVLWNGPSQETEYSRQIQIVDSMVARHVDGLAVAATDKTALSQPIERAAKAGILVTVFDSGVDTNYYLTFVATNYYEGWQMGARKLASLIHAKANVALLMNAPGSPSTMERENVFQNVTAKEFPNVQIVALP